MYASDSYLSGLLFREIIACVLSWILRPLGRFPAAERGGRRWLHYHICLKLFALIPVAAATLIFFKAAFSPLDEAILFSLLGLMVLAVAATLIVEFFFVKIGYDREAIHASSVWRSRTIDWADVESLTFSPDALECTIQTRDKRTLRFMRYMSGSEEFLSAFPAEVQPISASPHVESPPGLP